MEKENRKTPWGKGRNHVVWLEPTKAVFQPGEQVEIKALWGDMRNPELGEHEKWHAYMLAEEARLELPIREEMRGFIGGKACHLLSFKPERKGTYTIVLENNYGILNALESGDWVYGPKKYHKDVKESFYFYQYAKTIISMGELAQGSMKVGNELEIVPSKTGSLHTDDVIELTLLYHDSPLPGAELRATYSNYSYSDEETPGFYPFTSTTNADGKAEFKLEERGNWLFVAEHKVEKGIGGEYDKKWLNATLLLPGCIN